MLGENQLRKQIDRAAPRRDSDDFTLKLWNRLDIRLADEVELWFRVDDQNQLHRRPAHSGCDDRAGRRSVIDRAADQRLHADRTADENRFKIESFLTIKAFHLRDSELQLRYSDGGCRKVNLLKLCPRRAIHDDKNYQRKDYSENIL